MEGVICRSVAMDGAEMRQLTASREPDSAPRVSRDGSRIAFHSRQQGNNDIWVLPTAGGPAVKLTSNRLSGMFPSWSPDGGMISYYGSVGGRVNLSVVPAAGGDPRQITTGDVPKYFSAMVAGREMDLLRIGVRAPFGSSNIPHACRGRRAGTGHEDNHVLLSLVGGRDAPLLSRQRTGNNNLWELTVANGSERPLTRFPPGIGDLGPFSLAASKTHLYFTVRKDVGDIWVMDVVADDER